MNLRNNQHAHVPGAWSRAALCLTLLLSVLALTAPPARADYAELPAFPGAEGFGYAAAGGRGGEVYHVTSHELTGPGTFHDALTTAGATPRTVVFDISGDLEIPQIVLRDKAYITIAGQTAPGDGVTVWGGNIRFIDSHDIVIRYLRFRLGAGAGVQDDTMYFEDCQRVMIDHSSFSWGTDEVLSIKSKDYDNPESMEITVQWSIISEGLLTHSMGGLIEMNTISMHHNLYAHNNDRNPKTKGQIDFVNNVIYNWGSDPYVAGGESGTLGFGNVVGNYFIAGVNSASPEDAVTRGNENYSVFLQNNRIDSDTDGILDGVDAGAGILEPERPSVVVDQRFEYPPVHTQGPDQAYEYVLAHAGASLVRDAVDTRVIRDVRNQTGAIIGDENDVGGYPVLAGGDVPTDTDRDGMPDAWERGNGLDPTDAADRNGDTDGDGYTNLEEYLNELAAPGFPADYPMTLLPWTADPFEPPVAPEPEPEIRPVLDGELLRSVVINDTTSNGQANAAFWSVQEDLRLGDFVAGDRMTGSNAYTFEAVPDELLGLEWIRSAVGSRGATNDDVVSFYLTADTDVYVAHDTRISTKPEWLTSAFEETGLIITDSQPVDWEVYRQTLPAGSHVVMGPNNGGSSMNYFVLVAPTADGVQAPGEAPARLAATVSVEGGAALTWDPVPEASSYLVYRSSSLDPNWRVIGAASTTAFGDEAMEFGIGYQYAVSAVNAGGESVHSTPVDVVAYDPAVPIPAVPAAPEPVAHSYSVELTWAEVEGVLGYTVYRAATDGDFAALGSVGASAFVDEAVEPGTTYRYAVSATSSGGVSDRSAAATVTTGPVLEPAGTPEGLAAGTVTATAFALTWAPAPNADSYHVYRVADGDSTFERIGTTTSPAYSDDALSASATGYSYAVSASNELGESDRSAQIRVEMPLAQRLDDLTVTRVGDTFVGLTWTSHGGASQHVIYRSSEGADLVEVGTAKVDTFYDRTAEPDTEYTYVVRALNAAGESEPSVPVTVVTWPHQWDPDTAYTGHERVTHAGSVYEAQWWTQGRQPGDPTGPWAEVGEEIAIGDQVGTRWTPSWIYTGDELVVYQGQLYRAQWWNRNQEPGAANGPWRSVPIG
ncbi:carbohydrate-binding protein [Occultella aeris]|uniref:Exoglucanase B n=1 Tax=Occultella aeris TaxID=2761496 RepID=A0A7M4DME4_9MICO|nr:Exoglucanase B precursor [Occultella aeris]